jgi:thiopurine S-methyltransferase
MDAHFWHNLWDKGDTGWHLENTNPLLLQHISKLNLKRSNRIFVPLCGKTVDIQWLLNQGFKVVGIELNEGAIKELFDHLKLKPTITKIDSFLLYTAKNIDIFVGDVFNLNKTMLGNVDAIYNRGAIVALPPTMREKYTTLLKEVTHKTPQLVITFNYDQNLMEGPPFSVDQSLIEKYYANIYSINLLETVNIDGFGFNVDENIWLLT